MRPDIGMSITQPGSPCPIPEPTPDPAPHHQMPHIPNVPEPIPMPEDDDIPSVGGSR